MASIRPLPAGKGGRKTTKYQVDYRDGEGHRRHKQFSTHKEADEFAKRVEVAVLDGEHVPASKSITVEEAGKRWIEAITDSKLERSTVQDYERSLRLHIVPLIGNVKLTNLDESEIRSFMKALRKPSKNYPEGRSAFTSKRTVTTLGVLLTYAKKIKPKPIARNVVHDMEDEISGEFGKELRKSKPKIGEDIPSIEEIRALNKVLTGRLRPLVLTAIYTGLRASELRGLRWMDVKFDQSELFVRQKADRFNKIGNSKTDASYDRNLPLPKTVVTALREWMEICPKRDTGKLDAEGQPIMVLDLVFPNGRGKPESLGNILKRSLHKAWVKAGVIDEFEKDPDGTPKSKYTGLHCLRHFYASWLINSKERGGRGLAPKEVQDLMGHSTLAMTTDLYSHLFKAREIGQGLDDDAHALLP